MIKDIKHKLSSVVLKTFPKWQANRLYRSIFNRNINWKNPTEFNEKLRWLQFYTDTSKWSELADKYRVRNYLQNRGYGDLLVNLYGVWDNADNIDFTKLPDSFVIKTNHGCGSVYIINDKNTVDLEAIRQNLKKDLNDKFGVATAEPHYLRIKPVVIAEELLRQDGDFSTSLVDYKMYCVKGEPVFCAVMYNRDIHGHRYDVNLYDNNWKEVNHLIADLHHTHRGQSVIPKPRNFERMKQFCKDMCSEFEFVRMDFYECGGKLYFGEFTFTPGACSGGSLGKEASQRLSEKINLHT